MVTTIRPPPPELQRNPGAELAQVAPRASVKPASTLAAYWAAVCLLGHLRSNCAWCFTSSAGKWWNAG